MSTVQPSTDLTYTDQPTVFVIAEGGAGAAEDASRHADLRIIGTAGFAEAAAALTRRADPDLIVIETAGTSPETLADALPAIAAVIADRAASVVVSLRTADIDTVAGQLFGPRVQLLCDADVAERVAAYRLASGVRDGRLHDRARDADARLERLNAEVARFAETLAKLATEGERAPLGGGLRDSTTAFAHQIDAPAAPVDPAVVRDAIRARRLRAAHFADDLFADPAWDMLLDLFAAELEDQRVSVSSLCIAAAVPGTTALRWIGTMVEAGLFARDADAQDRRRAFVSLTPPARSGMHRYFDAVRRAGLMPA